MDAYHIPITSDSESILKNIGASIASVLAFCIAATVYVSIGWEKISDRLKCLDRKLEKKMERADSDSARAFLK